MDSKIETNQPIKLNLATRLGLSFAIVSTVTLLILSLVLIYASYQTQRNEIQIHQIKTAREVSLVISSYISDVLTSLNLFALMQPLFDIDHDNTKQGLSLHDNQTEQLNKLLVHRRLVLNALTLLDTQGMEIAKVSQFRTYLPKEYKNQANHEAFKQAMSGSHYISLVGISPTSGLLSINIAIPIIRGDVIQGVLCAEVNVTSLWQEVSNVKIGETGYAYLVDQHGNFIAYQIPSEILRRYGENVSHFPPVQTHISKGDNSKVYEYTGLFGDNVVGAYTPIKQTNWGAIIELPTDEAYTILDRMIIYISCLLVGGVLISAFVGSQVAKFLISPISRLTIAMDKMKSGQQSELIEQATDRTDEIGVLARAFKSMTDQWHDLIENLETRVADRTHELEVALEKLKELDRLKTEFLTMMSHELRTPLNSILGFSELLLLGVSGELDELVQNDVQLIHNSGQHLLVIINDVLDISKIEAGMIELVQQPLDVHQIVHDVQAATASLVGDKPIKIVVDVPTPFPKAYADRTRLKQILLSLVDNAVKFTHEGQITIMARYSDEDPDMVHFSVVDTGIGIPHDKQQEIFEQFHQADMSNMRQYGGVGLGLTICQQLIQIHGGTIGVYSEVDAGSAFYFTVPCFKE